MLTTIDTAISAIVTGQAESVSVAGDSYTSLDLDKLKNLRSHYASIVAQENVSENTPMFGITGLQAGSGK